MSSVVTQPERNFKARGLLKLTRLASRGSRDGGIGWGIGFWIELAG